MGDYEQEARVIMGIIMRVNVQIQGSGLKTTLAWRDLGHGGNLNTVVFANMHHDGMVCRNAITQSAAAQIGDGRFLQ